MSVYFFQQEEAAPSLPLVSGGKSDAWHINLYPATIATQDQGMEFRALIYVIGWIW
jgi:hypothetical protein